MTYEELLQHLQQLNEDQLNMDVYLYNNLNWEYHKESVKLVYATYDSEIFGLDQPIISF